jgi:hypothetical protein
MPHPVENDLALLAGGEAGRARRFLLERHVRGCEPCQTKVAEYQALRLEMQEAALPEVNWNALAGEMRANIRLGLEAGACVRDTHVARRWRLPSMPAWTPALTTSFVVALLLIGSGIVLRNPRPLLQEIGQQMHWGSRGALVSAIDSTPVLESTGAGVELRTGANSLILSNHHGNAAHRTVSAQGDVGRRYIDSETESVTITNVYLQ